MSPDPLRAGEREVRVVANRGSDFGWNQNRRGEQVELRRFLVDAEHQTVEGTVRYGVTDRLSVGVRLPVQWRGGGFLDGVIDLFHETTGFASNIREAFYNDRHRIEGFLDDARPFSWNHVPGVGVGQRRTGRAVRVSHSPRSQ